jgi:adenylyltransferase/sulfurtransferase
MKSIILSEDEKRRYLRQMIIPGWGMESQLKLKGTRIGVVGAGGLGSFILMHLVATGFGEIILIDRDRVEINNLNRQVLHWEDDIGANKSDSAKKKLKKINSTIEIISYAEEINDKNINKIFSDVDGLIDALDNFPDRFLINEFAVQRSIPLFHGAIWGFEGRVTTIIPGKTACLRCIYPEIPCQETTFPAISVSLALIGSIQVTEAIKYFTGTGELLSGQLLIYDGASLSFLKTQIERKSTCDVCSLA